MRFSLVFILAAVASCGGTTETSNPLAGTYFATVFSVIPTGQAPIDVLAAGGSLRIDIALDNSTTGSLNVPASINGGTAFTASMAGTASLTGSSVRFEQSADTFVRDLVWAWSGGTLTVANQTAGSASFTITLARPGTIPLSLSR